MDLAAKDVIKDLEQYGSPYLTGTAHGWSCTLTVIIPALGVFCTISSDTNHNTSSDAADQCKSRVVHFVKAMAQKRTGEEHG